MLHQHRRFGARLRIMVVRSLLIGIAGNAENVEDIAIISGHLVDLERKSVLLTDLLEAAFGIAAVTSRLHNSIAGTLIKRLLEVSQIIL